MILMMSALTADGAFVALTDVPAGVWTASGDGVIGGGLRAGDRRST
jgi:hypothetical protein